MSGPDWQKQPTKTIGSGLSPIFRRIGQVTCFSIGGALTVFGADSHQTTTLAAGGLFLACGLVLRWQWLAYLRDQNHK